MSPETTMREPASRLTKMALCVALCCIAAYISIPLPFTTAVITALTAIMCLTAFILPPKETFIVIFAWLLLGVVGLPVYVNGSSGFGRLFGPTGGFLWSFLVAYPLVSYIKGTKNDVTRFFVTGLISLPITYIGGIISMMALLDITLWQALMLAVFPFIPGDIAKVLFASFVGTKLNKIVG